MENIDIKIDKVVAHWYCEEHIDNGEEAWMSIVDIHGVGTPICGDCGDDMSLDISSGLCVRE